MVAAAIVGAAVVGGVASNMAANKGAKAQSQASQAGIEAENYRFQQMQETLKPFVDVGTTSLSAQKDLLGLNGPDAQKKAIGSLQSSPQFAALTKQGETGILQNASATGGLRGGNTEAALAQFRPQLLSQLINDQYSKLGGLTQIGQASAAQTGAAGMQNGSDVASLLAAQGQAQAGKYLAQGQAISNVANSFGTAAILNKYGDKIF